MAKKARLINYFDVWGNKKDGYEVNNLCEEGIVEFENDNPTNKEVVQALKEFGFFQKHVRVNMCEFHDQYDMIEISHRATQKPVCRLEFYNVQ